MENKPAVLVLADGTVFKGKAIGKIGTTTGEIAFNTGMTGYQEVFTLHLQSFIQRILLNQIVDVSAELSCNMRCLFWIATSHQILNMQMIKKGL